VAFDQDNPMDYLNQLPYRQSSGQATISRPNADANRTLAAH
jgi:hypothetical protein